MDYYTRQYPQQRYTYKPCPLYNDVIKIKKFSILLNFLHPDVDYYERGKNNFATSVRNIIFLKKNVAYTKTVAYNNPIIYR